MTAGEAAGSQARMSHPGAWLTKRLRPDPQRLVYATNIALITVTVLFLAFLLNLQNTYWGLISIPFVAQIGSGITVWRSVSRMVGTVAGALVGLAIIALFAQSPVASIAAVALWAFGVGYLARFEIGFDAYAYGTAGLTAIVIVFGTGPNADLAYGLALARLTETLIPVFAAFAILLTVFPRSVENTLQKGILDARDRVLAIVRQAVDFDTEPDPADRQAATKALSAAYSNLRAFSFERSHRGLDVDKVGGATNRLNHLLVAAETLSLVAEGPERNADGPIAWAVEGFSRRMEAIPVRFGGAEGAGSAAAGFRDFLAELDGNIETRVSAQKTGVEHSRDMTALHAVRNLAQCMASFLEAEAAVFDPRKPAPRRHPVAARYPDHLAAVQRGLRPALLLVAMSTLWIATASSSIEPLAMLVGSLSLVLPTIAPRPSLGGAGIALGLGLLAMLPVAVFLQIALPYVESFPVFALILASVMFVFFYICSAPGRLIYAFGGTIMLAITLQPANTQSYNPLGLFNTGAALALLPAAIAVAFTVIVPENQNWLRSHLRRGMRHLLGRAASGRDEDPDEFLAQSLDVIGDYGGDLDLGQDDNRALLRRARLSVVLGMELHQLHRLRRLGHLPRDLSDLVPEMGTSLAGAAFSEKPTPPDLAIFAEAENRAGALLGKAQASGPSRSAVLRFLLGARFLHDVARTRLGAQPKGKPLA
ncbi:FUSC family protein [Aureimonas psammosilenae]|uniref:FUSC family protein n=1 Tax=Aureimonas psammosilenae TaxID=2495496 RepID=UPI001260E1DD|nr:FUSC family protein [Aureimonas psammosilenae]